MVSFILLINFFNPHALGLWEETSKLLFFDIAFAAACSVTVTKMYIGAIHWQPAGKGQHPRRNALKRGILGVFVFITQWEPLKANWKEKVVLGNRKFEEANNVQDLEMQPSERACR